MVLYLPTYVRPPVVSQPQFGLMSVVQMPSDDVDRVHWRNGVQFQADVCDPALTTMASCPLENPEDIDEFEKDITSQGLPARGALSFTVYADIACSPVGNFWEEAEARAVAALTNGEARAVEDAFWTGEIASAPSSDILYPHLAADTVVYDTTGEVLLQPAATVIVTGAVDIITATGLLEEALGDCYGGVGVLHAPRELLAHMSAAFLIKESGGTMRTMGGTPIAFGNGYPGTAPDGSDPADGVTWMYATGAIMLRRSDIFITSDKVQALDRNVNTERLFAERTYNIAWDCCLFAIPVSLDPAT